MESLLIILISAGALSSPFSNNNNATTASSPQGWIASFPSDDTVCQNPIGNKLYFNSGDCVNWSVPNRSYTIGKPYHQALTMAYVSNSKSPTLTRYVIGLDWGQGPPFAFHKITAYAGDDCGGKQLQTVDRASEWWNPWSKRQVEEGKCIGFGKVSCDKAGRSGLCGWKSVKAS